MDDLDRFRQTYLTECFELLTEMEQRLMALDIETSDAEELNAIFRCIHSIKGGSGAFGLAYITTFTHNFEALLDSMRLGKVRPTRELVDMLLKATDIVSQMATAAKDNVEPAPDLGADIVILLDRFATGEQKTAEASYGLFEDDAPVAALPEQEWRIVFTPHADLFMTGNEPLLILRELARLGNAEIAVRADALPTLAEMDASQCYLSWTILLKTSKSENVIREVFEFVEDNCELSVTDLHPAAHAVVSPVGSSLAAAVAAPVAQAAKGAGGAEQSLPASQITSIRVDLEKVDRLVNMVGELVITEAMLRAQTRSFAVEQFSGLMRGIDELSQHTRDLQEAVMSVRMQPVKSIFARMPRVVRDISAQCGKDIRLVTQGENTEVDKTVIEQLSDPLMHMIRNSCDHGIETPDTRVDNGKSAQGLILLSADNRGGRIIIEIRDDGAGINRERVLAKAREKNLVAAEVTPSDAEIDNMIFMAGFSTADKVTNISGRGVGMDVVKRNIEGMGGTVRVHNSPGFGSRFIISLPLTLAILDGMIVRVGAEHYIIPITSISETLRPAADQVRHVEGHSDVINVRGEFVSVVYLHRTFGIPDAQDDPAKALVVLVESNGQKMGLVVDELIGQQQVVIKSLEANADPVPGVSGATILGDGRVSLILEINELALIHHGRQPPDIIRAA